MEDIYISVYYEGPQNNQANPRHPKRKHFLSKTKNVGRAELFQIKNREETNTYVAFI